MVVEATTDPKTDHRESLLKRLSLLHAHINSYLPVEVAFIPEKGQEEIHAQHDEERASMVAHNARLRHHVDAAFNEMLATVEDLGIPENDLYDRLQQQVVHMIDPLTLGNDYKPHGSEILACIAALYTAVQSPKPAPKPYHSVSAKIRINPVSDSDDAPAPLQSPLADEFHI